MKTKIFFVTGCFGFVGSHWTEFLIKKKYNVIGIDIKEPIYKFTQYRNFKYYRKTIFDKKFIEKIIKKSDFVFHFAAIASPDQYVQNPIKVMDLTALIAIEVAKLCNKHNKTLFFTSTSEIYGKNLKTPFSENSNRILGSTNIDRWCYSSSKALVEHYINALHKNNKLKFVIFRLFNIYGPSIEGRVVDKFARNAVNNKDLLVYGDGSQTRCFLYIDDCIEAFYKILLNKKLYNSTYNIGNNKKISMKELASLVINLCNSNSKIKYVKINKIYNKDLKIYITEYLI